LGTRAVQRVVARQGSPVGLENLTPHVLRHTFAKNLVDAGVRLEKVADLLGHSRLDTTRIYTRPGQRDLEQAVEVRSGIASSPRSNKARISFRSGWRSCSHSASISSATVAFS